MCVAVPELTAQRYLPGMRGLQFTAGTVNGLNPQEGFHAGIALSNYTMILVSKSSTPTEEKASGGSFICPVKEKRLLILFTFVLSQKSLCRKEQGVISIINPAGFNTPEALRHQ
jgi:hypothetical protein